MAEPHFPTGEYSAFLEGGWYRVSELSEVLQACWFPIETAPKDGTAVLLAWEGGGVLAGSWNARSQGFQAIASQQNNLSPSHWMPLPKTPNPKGPAHGSD